MFELNPNLKIKKEIIQGSVVYFADNFYKNPDQVADFLFNRDVPLWKTWENPSVNGIYFNDKRWVKEDSRIFPVYFLLSSLCCQSELWEENTVLTTMTRFTDDKFNDFENSVWWPHKDPGYNGIVYFTDDENNGTNLYSEDVQGSEEWRLSRLVKEHEDPWRLKKYYKVIKQFKSKYNRFVLFDGNKFPHGANYTNVYMGEKSLSEDVSWKEYRCAQTFHFDGRRTIFKVAHRPWWKFW